MKLGIVVSDDPWRFFSDIFDDWRQQHETSIFNRRRVQSPFFYYRINGFLFRYDLNEFLRRQDVVFFEWASDLLVEATQLPKTTRFVTRLHRYEMYKWVDEVNWDRVDRVILVSKAMQRKFAERFPEHGHKTVVVNVGVDTSVFTPVEKPYARDIGTLAFFTPRKRIYDLVLTFADLLKRRESFRLHIGGGGEKAPAYNEALESLVKKLNIQDKVTFYGEMSDGHGWYDNIDVFISNSYSEGLQVSPMEAMASGRYVLSHHWDGAEELVPEDQLYLTNNDLIEHILAYDDLSDEERQKRQKEMRARACERFDQDLIKRQLTKIIEEVASEPLKLEGQNRLKQSVLHPEPENAGG